MCNVQQREIKKESGYDDTVAIAMEEPWRPGGDRGDDDRHGNRSVVWYRILTSLT